MNARLPLPFALLAVALACSQQPASPGVGSGLEVIESLRTRDDVNVLFILVDTLRSDRMSAYGYERDTTPTIDAMARSGVLFADHFSQSSWTKASMASLWTSLYPIRTRVLRYSHALAPEATLASEVFQQAGFRTVGLWRNGWVAPNFGFIQGFDLYHRPRSRPIPANVRRENPSMGNQSGSDEDLLIAAEQFWRSYGDERWFLYLHMMDVHEYVYDEQSALFGTSYSDIYDNSIRRMDHAVALLLEELEERGLRDQTLVILSSDHGEAFGEHGSEGHARDVYAEVSRVPFVLGLPTPLAAGVVVEEPSENVDLWPTVLDLLGLPPLAGADGRSRLPAIRRAAGAEGGETETARFSHVDQTWGRSDAEARPLVALNEGRFRFFHPVGNPDAAELYDLEADPAEQSDLAGQEPERVARMREEVESYLQRDAPWGGEAPEVEIDEMDLNQLRALGYAID